MRIKGFFYILVFLLLALGSVLLFLSSQLNTIFFYIGEGLILFILIYLTFFYRKIVKPLNTIGSGMELLREQDFSSRLSPVGQYEADRVVNIFNRMMEQLKNERLRLREQNNFLDLLIKASPMGVIITSLDEDLSELNPMALKMLGVRLEDVQGKKKAEKKAYEKVIRMIAHEVNNTTAGITSTLDTVEQALSCEEGMEDICDVMRVCTDRCFSMSRFITRFADVVKIPEPTLSSVNLNDLVFTCKRFMEGMCNDRRITLRMEIDESLKDVMLDAALFEQVLVNIIKNAAESIEADGEIIVRTLAPATVEVIDNGQGISKETEAKLFSPFFSTKPNGQGIGLIFIREVLMRHGCTFSLRTYADGLTRFRITFP